MNQRKSFKVGFVGPSENGNGIAHGKIPYVLIAFMLIGVVLSWSAEVAASPTIASPSAPTNGTHVRDKQCSGIFNDGDCIWDTNADKLKVDVTAEASAGDIDVLTQSIGGAAATDIPTTPAVPATPVSGTATFGPAGKSMTCPSLSGTVDKETVTMTVQAHQTQGDVKSHSVNFKFEFRCYKCLGETKSTRTDGNGNTSILPQSYDQDVYVEFVVLNLDTAVNTIDLTLSSTLGWDVFPEIPSTISLGWGGDSLFLLGVIVPGGTPPGTTDEIILTSQITGMPETRSSDTVRVIVYPQCCDLAGDANNDGTANIADAVYLINFIFKGGPPPPCMDEADANADCAVNIADAVYLINYVFKSGPNPMCGCAL